MKIIEFRQAFYQALSSIYPETEIAGMYGLLLEAYAGMSRMQAALQAEEELAASSLVLLQAALSRLQAQEPIQYILGQADFYDLKLKVTPATLIPRPETEELVSWILSDWQASEQAIFATDIGTGSGCISLALKSRLSGLEITGVDVSLEALEVVKQNSENLGLPIHTLHLDVLKQELPMLALDFIVSNPPYVCENEKELMRANVLDYEPDLALFVEDADPLVFYRRILELANTCVKPEGCVYFEINENLAQETLEMSREMGWGQQELRKDIFGRDRMLKLSRQV